MIPPDGVVYVAVAKQFQATGSPFDPLFHPIYPILIALALSFETRHPAIEGGDELAQVVDDGLV